MNRRLALLMSIFLPAMARAGVNPQNGNFYVTYNDIVLKDGVQELVLSRTYNSKATERGWFGYGWGSPMETRLVVMPDGSAAIKENGTGQLNFYRGTAKVDVAAGVAQLVEAEVKRSGLSAEAAEKRRQELMGAEEKRVNKVLALNLSFELPPGTLLRGDNCPKDALSREDKGYRRNRCGGGEDRFDMAGRLVFRSDGGSHGINMNYEGGHPGEIRDNRGQSIKLSWTAGGHVAYATTDAGHQQSYTYDDKGDLIRAREQKAGEIYHYSYDSNHNLTSIRYADDTKMLIEYVSPQLGSVSSVEERNGERTRYDYREDPADVGHTWTRVTQITPEGARQEREFEFRNRRTETGEDRLIGVNAGSRDGKRSASFDDKGRITGRLDSAGSNASYIYHPRTGKLILVLSPEVDTQFHYDDQGNLTRVQDNKGHVVLLHYNDKGLVIQMNELGPARVQQLSIRYGSLLKPTHIAVKRGGTLDIEYGDNGEISKVHSPQGAKTALQITQSFQALLNLLRVTGVPM